jgi:predicted RNA-binding protein (virulence factor B family)
MPIYKQDATLRTPEVNLDPDNGTFSLVGESYPEDIMGFYGPIHKALNKALKHLNGELKVYFKLVYFNSSSARVLMELVDQMDEHAQGGAQISVFWYCDPDDDIIREFAEDISENLAAVKFEIINHMTP